MNKVKNIFSLVTLAVGLLMPLAAGVGFAGLEASGFISVKASELKWVDAPSVGPGAKIAMIEGDPKQTGPFMFRLKVPGDFKLGLHVHPAIEHVTILSGSFYFAAGDKPGPDGIREYTVGDAFIVPVAMPMYGYTQKQEAVLQIHGMGPWGITFLHPEDAPGKKK